MFGKARLTDTKALTITLNNLFLQRNLKNSLKMQINFYLNLVNILCFTNIIKFY